MRHSRRQFLASSFAAALFAGPLATSRTHAAGIPWLNWSGALRCRPASRFAPDTEAELAEFVAAASGTIRPVGSGHSFSPLVPTDGHIVVIDRLAGLIDHDPQDMTATFGAGTRLGDTGAPLDAIGQAMFNLPDIDRQTIAGAISTATHGTGLGLGGLPDYVSALRLVTADGSTLDVTAESDRDLFDAARVSLGALGIITRTTFRNRKPYRLRATNEVIPIDEALERFDEQAAGHRHHELFPLLWSNYTLSLTIDETDEPVAPAPPEEDDGLADLMAAVLAAPAFARVAMVDGIAGMIEPSSAVDDSWKILTNVRNHRFNEMEYSVPLEAGADCLREILATVQDQGLDVAFPLEYRYVRRDDTWLSMHSGDHDHAAISIHESADRDWRPYFDVIEPIFRHYGGRPHWGKLHSLGYAELRDLYPRFDEFCALRQRLDPAGKFLNDHLRRLFLA